MIHKCLHSFKRSIKRELRFGGEEVYKKIRKENFPNSKKGSRLLRACQVSSKVKFQSQENKEENKEKKNSEKKNRFPKRNKNEIGFQTSKR